MRRSGFTLVELLIVMGIVAILTGMLMPALSNARKQARSTTCKAQLNQIGHAVALYRINHRELLPACADYTGTQFFGLHKGPDEPVDFSQGYLSRYVGCEADIWQCPSFTDFLPRADGPCTGYAYNYHYLTELIEQGNWWDADYKYWWRGKHESVIRAHTTTALFGDSARNWMGPLEENWFWTPPSEARMWPGWETAYTHFRHLMRANVVWADGHVSGVEPHESVPLDKDLLGIMCDTTDYYFDPVQ